ncbi:hypothetical protein HDC92_003082 [Pedobacter sp. AK017]|uniref:hypothetical protein n=1 Tax=Pedobacter sp. AK017 TaxID=2723073 RepID=UPI0016219D3B|nr:hypothetical protein [Pedobacter sp. AK017]MBB5439389.1 hypothetical protein [Pedobacter sp. AK017]
MKYTNKILTAIVLTIGLSSCDKNEEPSPLSSLYVINGTVNLPSVKVNTTGAAFDFSKFNDPIGYGAGKIYSVKAGTVTIMGASSATPAANLFSFTRDFKPQAMYSLYLAGQMPNVETVVNEETYPKYTGEVIAVRVINLMPNSTPLNVTLASTPGVNEFTNIAYKQQSNFKKYAATDATPSDYFDFQVRDAAGNLISNYLFGYYDAINGKNKYITLVITGMIGGTDAATPSVSFLLSN